MLIPRNPSRWTLVLAGALAMTTAACSGDDGEDAGTADAGVTDTGSGGVDATVVDSGPRPDAGVPDTGPRPDAGHYCTTNGAVDVNGTAVPVADVAGEPVSSTGGPAVLSCIDNPPSENPPFISEFCFTECVSFFGATPSEAEVMALDIQVFEQDIGGTPVDPSYDYDTGVDRQPEANTGAGFRFVRNTSDCDSGWQVEIAYSNAGNVLSSETRYVVRVRTATTAQASWPTSYLYNFIRRNDQQPDNNCGNDEQRIPSRMFEFPVIPASLMGAAVTAAGGNVVGADDLSDGLGTGHALLEARDCAGGGGLTIEGVTAGITGGAAGAYYVADDYSVDTAATQTSKTGLYVAVGLGNNTATSSASETVVGAIGATRDGTCTEEFGGLEMPIFADGVTFLRMNRETVVHGR